MKEILYDKAGNYKIAGLDSRYFWIGLIIKLILAGTLASEFMTSLFAPFVNYFVSSGFENPYDYFMKHGKGNEFPYPPLMLWIMALPRIVFSPFFSVEYSSISNLDIFVYRIPLLLADFGILMVLLRWLKTSAKKVLIYYWLSPIFIYITYVHGQLDVIPIALLTISLYWLFKDKFILAAFFLGLAVCTKTNILIICPFILIYAARERKISYQKLSAGITLTLLVVVLVNVPYFYSEGFGKMVLQNTEQSKVFLASYSFSPHLMFYFIPAAYLCLLIRIGSFKFINKDLLLMFLAFSFGILTIFIPPMQGWYYWMLPFLIYFLIRQHERTVLLFSLLNVFYFLYFLVIPKSDYLSVFRLSFPAMTDINLYNFVLSKGGNPDVLVNIVFTLLQTTLLLVAYFIYRKGISINLLEKMKYQPFLLGIGGDSGAGKSTLTTGLEKIFGNYNLAVLRGDDMHKWERGNENWDKITHLNPKANDLHQDIQHASRLKRGERIYRKHYDHKVGKFTLPVQIRANKLVIFEGLHPFYLEKQAMLYDFKIFVKPDETLRRHWKVLRDMQTRGYTKEKVLEQLDSREADSQKYISEQAKYADIIVSFFSKNPIQNLGNAEENPRVALRLEVNQNFDMGPLLFAFSSCTSIKVEHNYEKEKQVIIFYGEVEKSVIERMAFDLVPELEDLGIYNSMWEDGYNGVLQLTMSYLMFQKINTD
jgi:uridine kinase/Gpi18-like mannosyltransferase